MRLLTGNDITNTALFRAAIDDAKQWMRLHHPASIHEAVVAHKERITRIDPRFDVAVSLVNDKPLFTLLAKENVKLGVEITGEKAKIDKKISDLLDKGALIAFQPGEIKVTGSKLFEPIEETGCEMQLKLDLPGSLSLVCHDAEGTELARLSDVPGRFSGGRKELWFRGTLANSPLTVKLGPIAPGEGGSLKLDLDFHQWDNQPLGQLAYFDRLHQFFDALRRSARTSMECQHNGNAVFAVTMPLHSLPFVGPLADFLDGISKARKVAGRFHFNPIWTVTAFDKETMGTFNELYDIFFDGGCTEPKPNVRLTANIVRKSFQSSVAKQVKKPESIRLTSNCTCDILGTKLELGKLVHDFTEMSMKVCNDRRPTKHRKLPGRRNQKNVVKEQSKPDTIAVIFYGTQSTVMSVRQAKPEDD